MPHPDGPDWPARIAAAYARDVRPPLTDAMRDDLKARLAAVWAAEPDEVNAALDAFEETLDAVAGPRLAGIDGEAGTVRMEHRSEAGRPLRAFGGQ
jgi:hypothetical protein